MTWLLQSVLWSLMAMPCLAAAPSGSFSTTAPVPAFRLERRNATPAPTGPTGYTAAPTPNQDAAAPQARASTAPTVAPSLFTRSHQYRGETLNAASSAQADQDRRAKPGAGFNLTMPIQ